MHYLEFEMPEPGGENGTNGADWETRKQSERRQEIQKIEGSLSKWKREIGWRREWVGEPFYSEEIWGKGFKGFASFTFLSLWALSAVWIW